MRHMILLGLLLVAGCTSLVPATVAQLYATSPLEADPAAIEIALVLPAGLRAQPGSAKMKISQTRKDTGEVQQAEFTLQARPVTLAGVAVPPDGRVEAYRLSEADVLAARAFQDAARRWEAELGKDQTEGSFGIGVAGCTVGAGPAANATASIYVRTTAGAPFAPLLRDASLREFLGADLFAALAPCDGPT